MTKHSPALHVPAARFNLSDASALQTPPNVQVVNSQSSSSSDTDTDTNTLTPDSQSSEILRMADALSTLTHGCLRRVTEGGTEDNPILQCVQIKPMSSAAGAAERYRVVMSDSVNFMQGMLGSQLNYLIHENKLKKGCLCRLTQFQSNYVKDKYILVILDLEILEEYGEPDKLGHPVAIEAGKSEEDVKPQPGNIAGNGFYGSKPQAQPQQNQERSLASRPNNSGGSHGAIYPIEALSPYAHRWTIKARCTHKGDVKHWHNKNGEGKLFSITFLDESGEIRATGFGEAVDSWYDVLQEGSVYYVSSPAKIQLAKKQFNNTNHDYEMTFEKDTMIEKAEDTDGVPKVTFNFRGLADLENVEKDSTIDCIGVLKNVDEVSEIVSKQSGKPFSKRELGLVDNTGFSVRLTIWGKTADSFEVPEGSVIAFKGVKVSDFGGRSLSLLSSGSMTVNPDIDEAHNLKGWYDGSGRNEEFKSHASTVGLASATSGGDRGGYKTVAQVRDENIGMTDTAEWFTVKGTIVYIKSDKYSYPACRTENCNKSMPDTGDGVWQCAKCEQTWDAPNHRYIMSVNVSDHTGQMWLTCFDETGVQIMGMSANELKKMEEEGEDRKHQDAFQDALCKTYIFRCKAKMDTYQDQQRVRYQVSTAGPLDYASEAKKLAEIIKKYNIDDNSLFVQ